MNPGEIAPFRFINYFKHRPWLIIWISACTIGLIFLASMGLIHSQGNGKATIFELSCVIIAIAVWLIAFFKFKVDLTSEYIMGWLFGISWEFLTEPYWTYLPDKFNILVWRDIPLLALVGWATNFSLTIHFSQWIGKTFFKLSGENMLFSWKILLCDAIAIEIICSSAEWLYGVVFHCWNYNMNFNIGKSPLGLPWEVHIGYVVIMFWYATTLRVWREKMDGKYS